MKYIWINNILLLYSLYEQNKMYAIILKSKICIPKIVLEEIQISSYFSYSKFSCFFNYGEVIRGAATDEVTARFVLSLLG